MQSDTSLMYISNSYAYYRLFPRSILNDYHFVFSYVYILESNKEGIFREKLKVLIIF